jgi:hypothetical protein
MRLMITNMDGFYWQPAVFDPVVFAGRGAGLCASPGGRGDPVRSCRDWATMRRVAAGSAARTPTARARRPTPPTRHRVVFATFARLLGPGLGPAQRPFRFGEQPLGLADGVAASSALPCISAVSIQIAPQRRRPTSSWQKSVASRVRPGLRTGNRRTTARTVGDARSIAQRISSSPILGSLPAANSRACA